MKGINHLQEKKCINKIRKFHKNYTRTVTPPDKEIANSNINCHTKVELPKKKPLSFLKFWQKKKCDKLQSMQAKALERRMIITK